VPEPPGRGANGDSVIRTRGPHATDRSRGAVALPGAAD